MRKNNKRWTVIGIFRTLLVGMLLTSMVCAPTSAGANGLEEPYIDTGTGLKTYNIVYYGYYPQDEVKGEELTEKIKNADYESGSAVVDGVRYKKIVKRNVSSTQSVGYYRYEPIAWRILKNDGNTLTLQATHALDSVEYSRENDAADYDDSNLRKWLNGTFLDDAFADSRGLKECSVGRRGDKITVFNSKEIVSGTYHLDNAKNRVMSASEYALANGVYTYGQLENYAVSYWTLDCSGGKADYINNQGTIGVREQSYERNAAVPVIQLAIDEYYYSTGNPETKQPRYDKTTDSTTWDVVEFGFYPQKELKGSEITAAIKNATYIEGISTIGDSQYMRLYINNEYRYFVFQPILWKVLERADGMLKLQSTTALDVYEGTSNQNAVSWESSKLHDWLKNTFSSVAFTDKQQSVIVNGNISILSEPEMHTESYGYVSAGTRLFGASDYAKAKGELNLNGYTGYWLRSEEGNHYLDGYVNEEGEFIYSIFSGKKGVVPVITIQEYPCLWSVNGNMESGNVKTDNNGNSSDSHIQNTPDGKIQTTNPSYFTKNRPNVRIYNLSSKKHTVSWSRISGAKGYIVYRSLKKSSGYKRIGTTTKNKMVSDKLKMGRTYYYYVYAYKTIGGKNKYSYRSYIGKKTAGYPKKPGISAKVKKKRGKKIVILKWDKVTDGRYIQLYRKEKQGAYKKILDKKIAKAYRKGVKISYELSSGKYTFKIRTYNKSGKRKFYSKMSRNVAVRL